MYIDKGYYIGKLRSHEDDLRMEVLDYLMAFLRRRNGINKGIPVEMIRRHCETTLQTYVPIPGEAETVRLIFQLRDQGLGRIAIAKELNARGVPAKNGGSWTEGCLSKILRNEKYCGDLLLQKQFRVDHLEKKDKPNEGQGRHDRPGRR